MRDSGGEPQRPGFDFRLPGERREYRDDSLPSPPPEEFPRLGEATPQKSGSRINGAWGLAILLVPILLLMAFAFIPGADSEEPDEASSGGSEVFIFLTLWFGPYVAGAIAAFRGNRRGITWTFPWTCLILLLFIAIPLGEPVGAWMAGFLSLGFAGFLLHLAARQLTRSRTEPSSPPLPDASYS